MSEDDPKLVGISILLKKKLRFKMSSERLRDCSSLFMARVEGSHCQGFCPSALGKRGGEGTGKGMRTRGDGSHSNCAGGHRRRRRWMSRRRWQLLWQLPKIRMFSI